MEANSPDRLSLSLQLLLIVVGAILCVIGWYRSFRRLRSDSCVPSAWRSACSAPRRLRA